MKTPRIYQAKPLHLQDYVELDESTTHRLKTVLRVAKENKLILFNGDGNEYLSTLIDIQRKKIGVKVIQKTPKPMESSLSIHLGQAISKGEKMDFVIQKATELGVSVITPLFSLRSVVHLNEERLDKKLEHWRKIAIHAAEQSGRTVIPVLEKPLKIEEWVVKRDESNCLVLDPLANQGLNHVTLQDKVALLIGPEGGLADEEIAFAISRNFTGIKLGPRILRTETATLAAITALQCKAGDLG